MRQQGVHYRPERVDSRAAGSKTTASEGKPSREIDDSGFEPGLIVHLKNLNPSTTKATINSFVCRSVDRYLRKKAKKQKKGKDDKDGNVTDVQPVKINYVDYEKGLGEAYTRQSSRGDSELIVNALRKRKKNMRDGEDAKGTKAVKSDKEGCWVEGKVLSGEEERIYWQKLLSARNIKGKGKGKKILRDENLVTSDFILGTKRTRKCSEASIPQVSKRTKFSE